VPSRVAFPESGKDDEAQSVWRRLPVFFFAREVAADELLRVVQRVLKKTGVDKAVEIAAD